MLFVRLLQLELYAPRVRELWYDNLVDAQKICYGGYPEGREGRNRYLHCFVAEGEERF